MLAPHTIYAATSASHVCALVVSEVITSLVWCQASTDPGGRMGLADGKVVLVTGAASGMGQAGAELFARDLGQEVRSCATVVGAENIGLR